MDAKTCLQKLQYVGVLAFATVDGQGAPQVRNISAIHYELFHRPRQGLLPPAAGRRPGAGAGLHPL